jgi:hypothetical protein
MEEKIEKFYTRNSELTIVSYEQYCEAVEVIKQYKLQLETDLYKVTKEVNDIEKFANGNSEKTFFQNPFSMRLYNGIQQYFDIELNLQLSWNGVFPISQLSKISLKKFAKCRHVGKSTIKELKDFCFDAGITLQP